MYVCGRGQGRNNGQRWSYKAGSVEYANQRTTLVIEYFPISYLCWWVAQDVHTSHIDDTILCFLKEELRGLV